MDGSFGYLYGNQGKDIIYGAPQLPGDNGNERLKGDMDDESDEEGGDDIIYTGDSHADNQGDYVYGGAGNDKLYGQGDADHYFEGNAGDDLIFGGAGNNYLYGDD